MKHSVWVARLAGMSGLLGVSGLLGQAPDPAATRTFAANAGSVTVSGKQILRDGNEWIARPHSTREEQDVVKTIKVLLESLREEDLAKFHSVVSPGFYIFDNGVRFDGDAVFNAVKSLHSSGKYFEWNVIEPDVHLGRECAGVAYVNDGMIVNGDVKSRQRWLESAFLDKRSGSWKIEFVQSTRVPTTPGISK